jgi:RNA polymerase sigma factor (TIGR02999 family)
MPQTKEEFEEITEILSKWNQADEKALDEAFPKVYATLKRLAKKARREIGRTRQDETLSSTVLVNEVYLKLCSSKPLEFKSRGRFYALCLLAMRRLLIDYYYRRSQKKNEERLEPELEAGAESVVNLTSIEIAGIWHYKPLELTVLVEEALTKLAEKHPRKVEVLYLKYFVGATDQEAADYLGTSAITVRRDSKLGEVLVRNEIERQMQPAGDKPLEDICAENRTMLKQLEILLKSQTER